MTVDELYDLLEEALPYVKKGYGECWGTEIITGEWVVAAIEEAIANRPEKIEAEEQEYQPAYIKLQD